MKKIYFSISLALFSLVPFIGNASTADVFVETGNNYVNAIEGKIILPKSIDIQGVRTGTSVVTIWVERPTIDSTTKEIIFSGITPGGFRGKGVLLSLEGEFKIEDLKKITFVNIKALKNDGFGTEVSVKMYATSSQNIEDQSLPIEFKPVVSRADDVFSGNYFVSFLTQDKETGVKEYKYATSFIFKPSEKDFKETSSPIVLEGVDNFKKIYIKAVDYEGNERMGIINGPHRNKTLVGILGVFVLVIFFRRKWST